MSIQNIHNNGNIGSVVQVVGPNDHFDLEAALAKSKNGLVVRYEWCDLRELEVHPDAQRGLIKKHLEEIIGDFDEFLAVELSNRVVVVVNGVRIEIDGQHNTQALLDAGITHAWCKVVYGHTSLQQAADWFTKLNKMRKVSGKDTHYIGITAEHHTPIVINVLLKAVGCVTERDGNKTPNNIRAIGALYEIFKADNTGDLLSSTLLLMRGAFADENGVIPPKALEARILIGAKDFLKGLKNPNLPSIAAKFKQEGLKSICERAADAYRKREASGNSRNVDFTTVMKEIAG